MRGRGSEISPSLSYSRPLALALALSSLAFFKTSKFQARFRFLCEDIAFFFLLNKKAKLEIAIGPNGTPYSFRGCYAPFYDAATLSASWLQLSDVWKLTTKNNCTRVWCEHLTHRKL